MIVKESKNYIFLRKSGNFYHVFDDDATIFNSLFGYKIINGKVGFPVNSINKITNILEEKKINYVIDDENKIQDFKTKNSYKKVLKTSLKQNDLRMLITKIENKLHTLSYDELLNVLEKLEIEINDIH